jgi:hypothetical protein
MKRTIIILTVIFSAGLICFITLKALWFFNEKRVLNVYILDKTVTRMDRPEHKAFTWVLNKSRFVLPNNNTYSHIEDYFGFFPLDIEEEVFDFRSVRINEVDAYASAFDLAYYTDCYGVYSFEWYKGKSKPIKSQKVYGGLNQNDYLLMKKLLDNGKLVISEYNMFSTPTNALVRNKTEELLNLNWSGWIGRYFNTLDITSNVGPPEWMKNLYESQHMGVWPNDKSGIVLLHNDGLMELMVVGDHLNTGLPIIETKENSLNRFGVAQNVAFEQWFELIHAGPNTVHASFIIDVTSSGHDILSKLGFSNVFPAIIEGKRKGKFFYFCGDFADNPARMWTAKMAGASQLNYFLYKFSNKNRAGFFRYYYTPLMDSILTEYYNSLQD